MRSELTAQPEFGEQTEEQKHAVLVIRCGRVNGQTAGLQQPPNTDHHQHLSEHAQRRTVPQETEPWAYD